MGNQQETVSEKELSWLAGILDGEGSIGISRLMSHRRYPTLSPRISIGNTNSKIVDEVRRIFKKIPVTCFIEKRQQTPGKNWKAATVLQISHSQGVYDLLTVITPYLIGKKLQAKILVSFLCSRIKSYNKIGRKLGSTGKGIPYSEKEINADDICIICYDELLDDKKSVCKQCPDCKNILHANCIEKWIQMDQKTCVYCRSNIFRKYKKLLMNN